MRVAIRFGPTTAARLGDAVAIARQLPGYTVDCDLHGVDLEISAANWRTVFALWWTVSPWNASSCTLDGQAATFQDLAELEAVFNCHAEREKSGLGDMYCVGKKSPTEDPFYLGCRFARGVRIVDAGLRDTPAPWWNFGTLDPNRESFLVDKEMILQVAEAQNRQAVACGCPAWSMERIRAVVKQLPGVLIVGEFWKLRYSSVDFERPIGVEPAFPKLGGIIEMRGWGEET